MKPITHCIHCCIALLPHLSMGWFSLSGGGGAALAEPGSTSVVPIAAVQWDENSFWGTRLSACRTGTLPVMTGLMEGSDRSQFIENFRVASGAAEGKHRGPAWNDGDTYKWLEAMSAMFAQTGDAKLRATMDAAIAEIAKAQREDGYLHTPTLIQQRAGNADARPFGDPVNFEMYNLGHLMTAACVHFEVTQDRKLLNIAIRAADFLDREFSRPDTELARHAICPAHYMGILDLYRTTGELRYLHLAQRWLEMRDLVRGGDDNQDRVPFRDQREAVGHAVRANYLYAGAADLFLETKDQSLWKALDSCWSSVQGKKIYITGGCGALYDGASPDGSSKQSSITRVHQAYGRNYQLPNSTAHNETCAAIGNVLWNFRMLQISGDAKYADALENSLYNAVLAGVSLDGERFFYTNTLRQLNEMPASLRWSRERKEWISCYCCPPNVARTVAGVGRYAYLADGSTASVLLYGSNRLDTQVNEGSRLTLVQRSDYPADGNVRITFENVPTDAYTLRLRIPGWCPAATLRINGQDYSGSAAPGTFVELTRDWAAGDVVDLQLEMPTKLMSAHPLVEECAGQIAVMRGPLVYCLESADLPADTQLAAVSIPADVDWRVEPGHDVLQGLNVLRGEVLVDEAIHDASLYRQWKSPKSGRFACEMIPYFAWGNRGQVEMSVWIPVR